MKTGDSRAKVTSHKLVLRAGRSRGSPKTNRVRLLPNGSRKLGVLPLTAHKIYPENNFSGLPLSQEQELRFTSNFSQLPQSLTQKSRRGTVSLCCLKSLKSPIRAAVDFNSNNTMKYINKLGLTSLIAAAISTAGISAQTDSAGTQKSEALQSLEQYVVVTSRTPINLERSSPSVSYISSKKMLKWQDREVTNALQREPGITIWSNGTAGSITSLSIRGTESNHSSFFLDGRRLNPGINNQFNVQNIFLNNLESVQLQKGPSSVNYGSANIGGTIALQSVSALGMEAGTMGSISAEIGTYNYKQGMFNISNAGENYGITIAGHISETENKRANDDFDAHAFQSRFDYVILENLNFEFLSNYSLTNNNAAGSIIYPSSTANNQAINWLISPGIKYATDELSIHAFYSHTGAHANIFGYSQEWSDITSDEISLQVDYSFLDDTLLTFGCSYRNDEVSQLDWQQIRSNLSAEQIGYWGQLQSSVKDDLEIRSGIRYDKYSDYENIVTGEFSVHYYPTETTSIFAKVGTSYAPPTALNITSDAIKTPELKPEESVSYEIGLRKVVLPEKLTLNLTAFRNEISNLIEYDTISYFPTWTVNNYNAGSARTEGLEFSSNFSPTQRCNVSLAYTLLSAYNTTENKRLVRRARNTIQFGIDYEFTSELNAGIEAIAHLDRQDIDPLSNAQREAEDIVVVRVITNWEISDQVSAFARIENLLDNEYATAAGYPALGRTGYIGVSYGF